jgi:Ca2+-transporting ATPase
MRQPPRPKTEPIVNGPMRVGIVVQTITQTAATLIALALGLWWGLQTARLAPPSAELFSFVLGFDFRALGSVAYEEVVRTGETMAFVTLSLAELFRAYTVRSERASLFQIGVFSNRYMQYAVGLSLVLLLLVVNVPFLQPFFDTHFLTPLEWATVVGLALIPAVSEEVTKFFLRRR